MAGCTKCVEKDKATKSKQPTWEGSGYTYDVLSNDDALVKAESKQVRAAIVAGGVGTTEEGTIKKSEEIFNKSEHDEDEDDSSSAGGLDPRLGMKYQEEDEAANHAIANTTATATADTTAATKASKWSRFALPVSDSNGSRRGSSRSRSRSGSGGGSSTEGQAQQAKKKTNAAASNDDIEENDREEGEVVVVDDLLDRHLASPRTTCSPSNNQSVCTSSDTFFTSNQWDGQEDEDEEEGERW